MIVRLDEAYSKLLDTSTVPPLLLCMSYFYSSRNSRPHFKSKTPLPFLPLLAVLYLYGWSETLGVVGCVESWPTPLFFVPLLVLLYIYNFSSYPTVVFRLWVLGIVLNHGEEAPSRAPFRGAGAFLLNWLHQWASDPAAEAGAWSPSLQEKNGVLFFSFSFWGHQETVDFLLLC